LNSCNVETGGERLEQNWEPATAPQRKTATDMHTSYRHTDGVSRTACLYRL